MSNDEWMHTGMMGWGHGEWDWLFGFHGIIAIIAVSIIAFAVVGLVSNWRQDQEASNRPPTTPFRFKIR